MNQGNPDEYSPNYFYPSAIITTKYGHEAIRLIHSIGKSLYIIISLLAVITIISIANTIGFHYIFAYDESIDFIADITLSLILIVILIPVVRLFIKSKTVLEKWMLMFERTSLSTSFNLALTEKEKRSAIMAVEQAIEPIGEALQRYRIETNSTLNEFMDISIDKNIHFDILIDSAHVLDSENSTTRKTIDNLKNAIQDYGAIIIEITDKIIDLKSVELLIEKISKYSKVTTNDVTVGIIIGESIKPEAKTFVENYVYKKDKLIHMFIILEKPQRVA